MADLPKLPPGATYTQRQGQATVSAAVKGDTLILSATCDSLQYLVYTYEKEITRMRNALEVIEKEKESCPSPVRWFIYGLIGGAAAATTVITIIIIRKNDKKTTVDRT
jgi:hypothetical protein